LKINEGLSYDDILLIPDYASLLPQEIEIKTKLAGNIFLNVPIVSAAMDTVTEEKLAIALALEGGTGVIHRSLEPEIQAEQVGRVKRFLNWIIEKPLTITKNNTVLEARKLMNKNSISGLPVIDLSGKLCGIITSRDLRFCRDNTLKVDKIMTPNPFVESENVTPESAMEKFDSHRIEKLPVINSKGKLIGLITVKDMEKHNNYPNAATDSSGRLIVGAAVSPLDYSVRIPLLIEKKIDFVVMDTAHGDSKNVIKAIEKIKPFKGDLKHFLHQLTTGLQKGMGYCGCSNIQELKNYKKFTKITTLGLKESHAHDIVITHEAPNYSRINMHT